MELVPLLAPDVGIDGVEIRVTTRRGGVSQAPYDSLNLGDHVGDASHCVVENRRRVSARLPTQDIHWIRQVHGIASVEAGMGSVPEADAQWTRERNQPLAVLTADCLPVVLADREARCVGIVHAGWRGLAAGVLESLLQAMPVGAGSVTAWLGPAISAAAYEVGPEVKDAFERADGDAAASCFAPSKQGGRWMADLVALARLRLVRAGVEQITEAGRCTFGEPEHFFSHRRDGVQTGRMATLVWLS